MDVPKEFENEVWPSIRDKLPRGKKTNALNDIKNEIRGIKDNETIKNTVWKVIEQYFGPDAINRRIKKTTNKKIDKLFQVKDN
jgi:hypothetical protein